MEDFTWRTNCGGAYSPSIFIDSIRVAAQEGEVSMGEILLLFFIIVCATVVSNYLFNRIYSFFYRRHDERRSALLATKGAI